MAPGGYAPHMRGQNGACKPFYHIHANLCTVSCWYLMMGRFTPLQEVGPTLRTKVTKIVAVLGKKTVTELGYGKLRQFEECLHQQLMAP